MIFDAVLVICPFADQPLLGDRGEEHAIARVHRSKRQPARSMARAFAVPWIAQKLSVN